jgi:hypothetical protein
MIVGLTAEPASRSIQTAIAPQTNGSMAAQPKIIPGAGICSDSSTRNETWRGLPACIADPFDDRGGKRRGGVRFRANL